MGTPETITHTTPTGQSYMYVDQYVGIITPDLGTVRDAYLESAKQTAVQVLLDKGDFSNYSLFSNSVAETLAQSAVKFSNADTMKMAVEAFEFAYDVEDPYSLNRTVYGGNFVHNLAYLLTLRQVAQDDADTAWRSAKAAKTQEILGGLSFFEKFVIYQQGFENIKAGEPLQWSNEELRDRKQMLEAAIVSAGNVVQQLSA